jgi:dTDP-4-dehydrorhamnose 3,5-epimerase
MIIKKKIEKFTDSRGEFFEIPNLTSRNIEQYSVSKSKKHVLRGLHYQFNPEMGKQINVIKGSILDCAVDLRRDSPFYGCYEIVKCTPTENNSIYIPPGFAHGFLSLEDDTTLLYLQTSKYNKNGEGAIYPFDDQLKIDWNIDKEKCVISEKDLKAETFLEFTAKNFNWSLI